MLLLLILLRKRKIKLLLWFGMGVVLLSGILWRSPFHSSLSNYYHHHHPHDNEERSSSSSSSYTTLQHHVLHHRRIKVFSVDSNHPNARKQRHDLAALSDLFEHVVFQPHQQRAFLESAASICGEAIVARFDEWRNVSHDDDHDHDNGAAQLLWKYCELYVHGGVVLDATASSSSSPSLFLVPLDTLVFSSPPGPTHSNLTNQTRNVAILNDATLVPHSLHGSLLSITQPRSNLIRNVLHLLLNTTQLQSLPRLVPQTLYRSMQDELERHDTVIIPGLYEDDHPEHPRDPWYILELKCSVNPFRFIAPTNTNQQQPSSSSSSGSDNINNNPSSRMDHHNPCPHDSGYCCHVYDHEMAAMVAMTRDAHLPHQVVPTLDQFPKPFHSAAAAKGTFFPYQEQDLPYMATVRLGKIIPAPRNVQMTSQITYHVPYNRTANQTKTTHWKTLPTNMFEALSEIKCLPSKKCIGCFRKTDIVTSCDTCGKMCACFCETMCQIPLARPRIRKVIITLPQYQRDPARLIPRIIHQTWFEPITTEHYAHTGRFVESFKQSGWEYRFYTDDMAAAFISTHFPPQVRQAYDDLLPGAFKADLFRYCVLLIHGGLYADVDIMLESNLDAAIDPDVGFLAPLDCLPGYKIDRRMCLWNGFIAIAPGHPFMAKVIETVVNNIRNRFTLVDYDNMYCPTPELSILHGHDDLFTSGPCILGAVVNQVMGRDVSTQFDDGDLQPAPTVNVTIPGRSVILWDSKDDLGAHRFTHWDKNMIVAGTDFPDSNDRKKTNLTHYSSLHRSGGIYGAKDLYVDQKRANEELRFVIAPS